MSERKSAATMALEVLSIVFGVLLALGVSEWAEEREKNELAEIALVNVTNELTYNLEVMVRVSENNQKTFELMKQNLDTELDDSEEDGQFIPGVQIRATAWEALLSSGIANYLDYSTLLALAEIYSMQSIYKEMGMKIVDASISMAAMATVSSVEIDNRQFQAQFFPTFSMLVEMEKSLLVSYQETLDQLKSR